MIKLWSALPLAAAALAMSAALPACGAVPAVSAVPGSAAKAKAVASRPSSAQASSAQASGGRSSGTGPSGTGAGSPATPRFTAAGPVVALGDSYTAGLLLPLAGGANTPGCFRSTGSYAARVAKAVHAKEFTDVSCQSAGVAAMTSPQRTSAGTNPPQLSVLRTDDSVVMLTLSGDDMGFSDVLGTCMRLSFKDPAGSPCQSHYRGQVAQLISGERPKMTTVLSAIRARAPRARVLLLGYPDLFPGRGGCWPVVPITDGDIAFLRGAERQLDTMLAGVASATGVTYVDTYQATVGHDFCTDAKTRDVEGLIPATMTYAFHPNARGQSAMAAQVLAALP